MKNFPLFLWESDEFLDLIIGYNQDKYLCFENDIPKALLMNLKKLELYFLCTWYFYQKRMKTNLWMLFANNMMMSRRHSYKYMMALTNNTYLSFITRFAQFVPDYDFTRMTHGLFKMDIQTNLLASRVTTFDRMYEDCTFVDYKLRYINFDYSSCVPSMMHRIIMRIHMIQHAMRLETEASFLWYACLYISLEDLLCFSTWMELLMFGQRIYDKKDISVTNILLWKKCCYDLSLGIMSFGRGILKLLNIIVDCDINGEDFFEVIHKRYIEIPPEALLGFIGVEMFRLDKTWFHVYSKYKKTALKRANIISNLIYTKKLKAYAPCLDPGDRLMYTAIIVNEMFGTKYSSMIFNSEFILLEGAEQIMCDPKEIIRDKNRVLYCDYQWIFACDFHSLMMTKIINAAYKGGFEKNNSPISISLFPINYIYLQDNSAKITKIASRFENCKVNDHIELLTNIIHTTNYLSFTAKMNLDFIDSLDQHDLIKNLLCLNWLFQFDLQSLVNCIAETEKLLLH